MTGLGIPRHSSPSLCPRPLAAAGPASVTARGSETAPPMRPSFRCCRSLVVPLTRLTRSSIQQTHLHTRSRTLRYCQLTKTMLSASTKASPTIFLIQLLFRASFTPRLLCTLLLAPNRDSKSIRILNLFVIA